MLGVLAAGAESAHIVEPSQNQAQPPAGPAWTPGTRLHIVAARDSRLFTLCPPREALITEAMAVRRTPVGVLMRHLQWGTFNKLSVTVLETGEGADLPPPPSLLATVLLLTDGLDTRSRLADAPGTEALVGEAHVPVYAIQFDTRRGEYALPYGMKLGDRTLRELTPVVLPEGAEDNAPLFARADAYLTSITSSSGGRLYRAESLRNLGDAFLRVAKDLGEQYTLGYYPTNQARDGTFRTIRVEVHRPEVQVHTRPGYRAGVAQGQGTASR